MDESESLAKFAWVYFLRGRPRDDPKRGIGASIGSMVAGRIISKVDCRLWMGQGALALGLSMFMVGAISLNISPGDIIWPIIISGFAGADENPNADAVFALSAPLPALPKGERQDSVNQQEKISGRLPKLRSEWADARKLPGSV